MFGFSQTEANGFVILSLLSVVLLVVPLFLKNSPDNSFHNSDKALLDSLVKSFEVIPTVNETRQEDVSKRDANPISYSKFDPNSISVESWQGLGVSKKIASRIKNYLSNGGSFKVKSDLTKIYGFDQEIYSKLEPYILLPEKKQYVKKNYINKSQRLEASTSKEKKVYKSNISNIFLNTAEPQDFMQVHGIGAKLSDRIVKFRGSLGGFNSKNQLYDIWGIDSSVVQSIIENSTLNIKGINQININTVTLDSLKKHPYISYKVAKIIVNYRMLHGDYKNIDDLKKIHIINDDLLTKVRPYIKLE